MINKIMNYSSEQVEKRFISNSTSVSVPKAKSHKLLWCTLIVGTTGFGIGAHQYYSNELLDYMKITANPNVFTKSLMKLHILPSSLPDVC